MIRSRRILLGSLLLVAGLIGCTADEVGGPPNDLEVDPVEGVASSFASCTAGLVALTPGSGIPLSELTSLANGFNNNVIDATGLTTADRNKLRRVGAYNLGSIPSGTLTNITVKKDSTGPGTGWCGDNNGLDSITVSWCFSGGPGDPTALQNRKTTILHELWSIMNSTANKLSNWDAAAGCSMHPGSNPTTTVPCVHEVQYEYDFCAVRPVSLTPNVDLYTGVNISGPSSLDEQQSAQYTAGFTDTGGGGQQQLVFGGAGSQASGVEHVNSPDLAVVLDPAVAWSSSSHLSLSSSSANPTTATGAQVGNGQLTVTLPPAGSVVYPQPKATKPVTVSGSCNAAYSPSSAVIEIGEIGIFTATQFCSGITASLSPTNGRVGFSKGTACSLTSLGGQGLYKVRGCQVGSATLTIRQDGIVVQTININVVN